MSTEEAVDIVDEHDAVVGSSTVGECTRLGLIHRAVAVLVVRSTGKFLLQQRSRGDSWHPGLWTLSCTGHVRLGEAYEAAAKRELYEEIGVSTTLTLVRKRLLPPIRSAGLTEHEWVASYVAHTDMPCRLDRTELEGVEELGEAEVRRMSDNGLMTPDAVMLLSDYIGSGAQSKHLI